MYGAGRSFDELLDRLHAMGAPPPRWGRKVGKHEVWCNVKLPTGNVERLGEDLETAARNILTLDLSADDKDVEAAQESLT